MQISLVKCGRIEQNEPPGCTRVKKRQNDNEIPRHFHVSFGPAEQTFLLNVRGLHLGDHSSLLLWITCLLFASIVPERDFLSPEWKLMPQVAWWVWLGNWIMTSANLFTEFNSVISSVRWVLSETIVIFGSVSCAYKCTVTHAYRHASRVSRSILFRCTHTCTVVTSNILGWAQLEKWFTPNPIHILMLPHGPPAV